MIADGLDGQTDDIQLLNEETYIIGDLRSMPGLAARV